MNASRDSQLFGQSSYGQQVGLFQNTQPFFKLPPPQYPSIYGPPQQSPQSFFKPVQQPQSFFKPVQQPQSFFKPAVPESPAILGPLEFVTKFCTTYYGLMEANGYIGSGGLFGPSVQCIHNGQMYANVNELSSMLSSNGICKMAYENTNMNYWPLPDNSVIVQVYGSISAIMFAGECPKQNFTELFVLKNEYGNFKICSYGFTSFAN